MPKEYDLCQKFPVCKEDIYAFSFSFPVLTQKILSGEKLRLIYHFHFIQNFVIKLD